MKQPVFVWSDAWVLAAVAVGGGLKGCGLKDIIAAGELINPRCWNAPEIRNALGKLIHAGHVTRRGAGQLRDRRQRARLGREAAEGIHRLVSA
jgi:hypothetical protein